jgi:hypothetical protein
MMDQAEAAGGSGRANVHTFEAGNDSDSSMENVDKG